MIDIGTTTPQLARRLHGRELTVITSNLAVIEEVVRSLVGVLAGDALRQAGVEVDAA
jgi:DeoR/GlpR family transcriptional regulator of sugar metabolism